MADHLTDGTFRADRHADRGDVQFSGTSPNRPRSLQAAGRNLWDTIIEEWPSSGLSKLDTSKLTILCRTADLISKAKQIGEFIRLAEIFDRYGRQFGLSPMDRASIKIQPEPKVEDEAEAYKREMAGFKVTG